MDEQIEICAVPPIVAGRARGGRASQQDEVLCLRSTEHATCLLLVADGMGGDGAGELASRGVVSVARRLWDQGSWRELPGALFLETLCQQAHLELRRIGAALVGAEPHSTVVALLVQGRHCAWAHVGDSRLYRFQGRRCVDRTEDHSLAQLKVRRGEISAEHAARDPDQHKLLRGLGGPQPPQVEHGFATLRPGQAFALCSDGVWEQLSTPELAELSQSSRPPEALRRALNLALERGGEEGDNVALILFRFGWLDWLLRRRRRTVATDVDR